MSVEQARGACITNIDPSEYFDENVANNTNGLKQKTAVLLIEAEEYGKQLENKRSVWMSSDVSNPHDVDLCLSAIHDIPTSFTTQVDATKTLRQYGH